MCESDSSNRDLLASQGWSEWIFESVFPLLVLFSGSGLLNEIPAGERNLGYFLFPLYVIKMLLALFQLIALILLTA